MDVVFVSTDFEKMYLVPFFYLETCLFDYLIHLFINNHTSILGGKYDVVQENGDVVAFVDELAHAYSVS